VYGFHARTDRLNSGPRFNPKPKQKRRYMKFNVQVRADVPNTFAKKNGEKVQERLLTCIDLTPDAMVADSFEVLASNLPFNEAGSLVGKTAELHVTHMVARNVGVRLQGKVFPASAAK